MQKSEHYRFFLFSGMFWAGIAFLLAFGGALFGNAFWGGVLLTYPISFAIGWVFWRCRRRAIWIRIPLALVAFVAATALFGLGISLLMMATDPARVAREGFFTPVFLLCWGLLFGWPFIVWPLACSNYYLFEQRNADAFDKSDIASNSDGTDGEAGPSSPTNRARSG